MGVRDMVLWLLLGLRCRVAASSPSVRNYEKGLLYDSGLSAQ